MIIYQNSDELKLKNNVIKNNIILITQFFIHNNSDRNEELKYCLKQNVINNNIDKIILLNEKIYALQDLGIISDKIIQIDIKKRLEYYDVFNYVNIYKVCGYIIYINSVLQQLYVKPILTRYLSLLPLRHEITITTKQGFRKKDFKKLPCKKKLRVQQVNGNPTKRAAKTGTKKGKGRRRRQFPLSVFTYSIYI